MTTQFKALNIGRIVGGGGGGGGGWRFFSGMRFPTVLTKIVGLIDFINLLSSAAMRNKAL